MCPPKLRVPAERDPNASEQLPAPSAELVLILALVEEFVAELPRKKRIPYLARVTTNLESRVQRASILRIRPAFRDPETAEATRQAHAFWRQAIGVVMSRMAGLE